MTKIKLCGLYRPCDITFVNEAKPDFCGFVIDVPKSHRNVTPAQVRKLRQNLDASIRPVGVFVNAPVETICSLTEDQTISMVQLHGDEDETYLGKLKGVVNVPICKAFSIHTPVDIQRALSSSADFILLDNGPGGTGNRFDWDILPKLNRPFFLAGGLNPDNLETAIEQIHPWAVDLSSGVETNRKKDINKMIAAVSAVRRCKQ